MAGTALMVSRGEERMIARKSVRKHPGRRCDGRGCHTSIPVGAGYWYVPQTHEAFHLSCLPGSYREVRA